MWRFIYTSIAILVLCYFAEVADRYYRFRETVNRIEATPCLELARFYRNQGIKFPRVAAAQTLLETGELSSSIYKENKNLFGMKASTRKIHSGINRGHAKYEQYIHSIRDYKGFQKQVLKLRPNTYTEEDYLNLLDNLPFCKGCRYATDENYTKSLKRILKSCSCPQ